jgi:hypothetical protein
VPSSWMNERSDTHGRLAQAQSAMMSSRCVAGRQIVYGTSRPRPTLAFRRHNDLKWPFKVAADDVSPKTREGSSTLLSLPGCRR